MKRILLVLDISNLYYCVKKNFNSRIDFKKLKSIIKKEDEEILRAIAYGAYLGFQADKFIGFLQGIGFETQYKEAKTYGTTVVNGETKDIRKADWDVGISMDVVKILDQVDIVVFGTADGDMAPCLEYVKSRGKIARVVGSGISKELRAVCDEYIEIGPDLLFGDSNEFNQERESVGLRSGVTGDPVIEEPIASP